MSTVQKFKKGDYIIWDNILWLVLNTDNQMYELELVNPRQFNTRHGNGGYLDSSIIDETATKFSTSSSNDIVQGRNQNNFLASNGHSSLKGGKRKSKKKNMMHGGFEVFVKEQNGAIAKIIDIDKSDTIDKVKQMATDKFGIDKWRFRLNYGTKILKDDLTVGDYNIEKDSTLRMMFT